MDQLAEFSRISYRAFAISDNGRLNGVPWIIVAADDREAVLQAESLDEDHVLELWDGARLVVRVAARTSEAL